MYVPKRICKPTAVGSTPTLGFAVFEHEFARAREADRLFGLMPPVTPRGDRTKPYDPSVSPFMHLGEPHILRVCSRSRRNGLAHSQASSYANAVVLPHDRSMTRVA